MATTWLSLIDANGRWVLSGTMLLGLTAGVLGSFALLRRRSLMGDALAHAALPGVTVAYLLTGSKQIGWFMVGAAIAGLLATMTISFITRHSKIKEDSAMGLVLTVFFGVGVMLLTVIQRSPRGNQSGLDKFLFGQAASMVLSDVQMMVGVAAVLCLLVFLFFKEFKLLSFDVGFGAGLGMRMELLDLLLNLMVVLAVVIGLQAVGVVLMAALLITPAVAARYWTGRLGSMVLLAGLFGAISGLMGTLLSQTGPQMSTGPLIVLSATALFVSSLLFAPRRGLIAKGVQFWRLRLQVAREHALRALYELAEEIDDPTAAFHIAQLQRRKGLSDRRLPQTLRALTQEGLLQSDGQAWALSPTGLARAHSLVREQRLREVYLMHEGELGGRRDGKSLVDGGPLSEGLQEQLEHLLRLHNLEPHLISCAPAKEGV